MITTSDNALVYDLHTVSDLLSPGVEYITFYDLGLSIVQLRKRMEDQEIFQPQHWYENRDFAYRTDRPCIRQLRLHPINLSFFETLSEQLHRLPEDEEMPSARSVVTAMVLHFLATGERLFADYQVRCCDKSRLCHRACVGSFGPNGLRIDEIANRRSSNRVALVSSRKF